MKVEEDKFLLTTVIRKIDTTATVLLPEKKNKVNTSTATINKGKYHVNEEAPEQKQKKHEKMEEENFCRQRPSDQMTRQ